MQIKNFNKKLEYDLDYVKFCPYLIYPETNVMWNGLVIDITGLDNISSIEQRLEDCIIFDTATSKLCFPKLTGIKNDLVKDSQDNITCLGWLMHQVGINVSKDAIFKDLDLLKTKKTLL